MRESVSGFKLPETGAVTRLGGDPIATDLDHIGAEQVAPAEFEGFDTDAGQSAAGPEQTEEPVSMAEDIADTLSEHDTEPMAVDASSDYLTTDDSVIDGGFEVPGDDDQEFVVELDTGDENRDDNERRG